MVMNIFTSFFSLCYGHRKPCQHCRLQSSPQTLLQWLDTPAFQRKEALEKAKEWLPLLVDHVLWGNCLPVWLTFNLLAGINPSLPVWSFSCCLCGRAGAGTASTQAPAPVPTLRAIMPCLLYQDCGSISQLRQLSLPSVPPHRAQYHCSSGQASPKDARTLLPEILCPTRCPTPSSPDRELRVSSHWVTGLRACHGAWLHSCSSGEVQVLAYLLLPRKLNKAGLKSRPNANNI